MTAKPSPFAGALALLAIEADRRPHPGGRPRPVPPSTDIGRRAVRALEAAAVDRALARPVEEWAGLLCPYVADTCQAAACAAWVAVGDAAGYCARVLAAKATARGGRG